jgi:nucleotide-binding universal stress UspA family protein
MFRRQAETYLAAQVTRLRDRDLAATGETRTGIPAGELLAAVKPGDLVVVTTHGRGGVRRWLLGSVAEKLVRLASAPVLLVRAGAGR